MPEKKKKRPRSGAPSDLRTYKEKGRKARDGSRRGGTGKEG